MKKICLISLVILLISNSCELFEDLNTVDLDSTLSMDIPVVINEPNASTLKSVASYSFSESGSASLSEDYELQDYLDRIRSIDVENVTVRFYGLQANQVVESVVLTVSGVGEIATISNITSNNATHNPTISSENLEKVANYLSENLMISATVSGSTNQAPMWFSIETEYDIVVKAKAL